MLPFRSALVVAVLAPTVLVAPAIDDHVRAVGLLARFDGGDATARFRDWGRRPVHVEDAEIPGVGRARLYLPVEPLDAPGVVLAHGVHPRGIEVKRLVSFARAMAEAGIVVATPELAEMTRYRISPASVEGIGRSAAWLAERTGRARAGVVGISFAGGLALITASEPAWRDAVGFVVALGAHHDVRRIARWYVGREVTGPDGRERPEVDAHPYGAGILVDAHLDALVPAADVPAARRALHALLLGDVDRARSILPLLSDRGATELRHVIERDDDDRLGALLLDALDRDPGRVAAVSPAGRLDELRAPVFLVHGLGDPIVPSTETLWLAREVPDGPLRAALRTPLFRHAELSAAPAPGDYLDVVSVIADILREARDLPRRRAVDPATP